MPRERALSKLNNIINAINERLTYVERWLVISTATAIISSLAIGLFYVMLHIVTFIMSHLHGLNFALGLHGVSDYAIIALKSRNKYIIPLTVVAGAALAAVIVYRWAPEAEGGGTDAIVEAYHHGAGIVRPRVALVKAVASALLLGTGGSGGPEGPAVQIGGAAGSFASMLLRLSVEERKIAVIAGVAAALSFIFKSPVGAAIFAVEVLYEQDMEVAALIPSLFASVIAYALSLHILGPEYRLPSIAVSNILNLYSISAVASYILLGLFVAPFAYLYVFTFRRIRESMNTLVEKRKIPVYVKPVIGALFVGTIGLLVPHILGTGEELLTEMLRAFQSIGEASVARILGSLHVGLLMALFLLAVLKILATSLTVGSGGSGGLLAPGLYAGAMVGELFGLIMEGHTTVRPALYAYLGMAALFGAASKVPVGLSFLVAEIGGSPALIVPALITSLTASLATRGITIVESQLPHPISPRIFTAESLLQLIREYGVCIPVDKLVNKSPITANWNEKLGEAIHKMINSRQHIIPVVDDNGRVVGVLDPGYAGLDLRYALRSNEPVAEVSLSQAPLVRLGDCVTRALEQMVLYGTDYVIVVDNMLRYVGVVTLEDLVRTLFPMIIGRLRQERGVLTSQAGHGLQAG
ncbi:hypothetical protein CF15_04185 [Pyrodictium occultum]|uniref:CBS domain-containing protein n=1 Tax=Pyrodictium occultum TaxID=2309 RepID=A0A0V8RVK5_PYROC|nr:chloride channel protein [Pyrodictium occultum]KSW11994.1 hypothetical protein CF15_04185 [Pyrodictium occultum]